VFTLSASPITYTFTCDRLMSQTRVESGLVKARVLVLRAFMSFCHDLVT
jgi:hypothetical protein